MVTTRCTVYLLCSYMIVSALYLGLLAYLPFDGRERSRRIVLLFRVVVALVVVMAALAVAGGLHPESRSLLIGVGRMFFYTYYTNSVYASPVLIILLGTIIIVGAFLVFRSTAMRATSAGRKARAFAVCALVLLPLVPYGVVEGQTLVFGKSVRAFLQHDGRMGDEQYKVLCVGPGSAVVGVSDVAGRVYWLRREGGDWRIESSMGIKGEYIGVFPPYASLDW